MGYCDHCGNDDSEGHPASCPGPEIEALRKEVARLRGLLGEVLDSQLPEGEDDWIFSFSDDLARRVREEVE